MGRKHSVSIANPSGINLLSLNLYFLLHSMLSGFPYWHEKHEQASNSTRIKECLFSRDLVLIPPATLLAEPRTRAEILNLIPVDIRLTSG